MKKTNILTFLLLFCFLTGHASRVDKIEIKSDAMYNTVKTIVIVPEKAIGKNAQHCPVIYLLHGYMGDETSWLGIKPELPQIADEKGIIIVCPDGKNSWYLNSPLDKNSQYETFISGELIDYIDKNYNTKADRKYRAITGLSMGGHGALLNAMKHPDVFGAAGSMSGAVEIRMRDENFGLKQLLGEAPEDKVNWDDNSVMTKINAISNAQLAIYIDCGVSDFVFEMNEELNQVLWEKGIDHEYVIRQGKHDADYWNNSIDYHVLFFSKFFATKP